MDNKIKKIIAAVLSVAVVSSIAVLLAGCGGGDKSSSKSDSSTVSTTKKESSAASKTNGQDSANSSQASQGSQTDQSSQDAQGSQSSQSSQTSDGGDSSAAPTVGNDGYIDESTAIANVRALAGTGAQILNYYKGYAPDGIEAWVVTVQPVTREGGAETVTYYSGYQFCYPETSSDGSGSDDQGQEGDDGYIDESTAIANVKALAGTGAQILGSYKGYAPDGTLAWVITVQPVTRDGGDETVTYYSGYQFCYHE